jgi:hypothetical protein
MQRRTLLFFAAGRVFAADPAAEVWELITAAATALGSGSASEFLAAFDPAMPEFQTLRVSVTALVQQNEVQSAIDAVQNEGDARVRNLELDWQLHITSREETARVTRRRETLKARAEKRGRKWKLVGLAPVSFFAPPGV